MEGIIPRRINNHLGHVQATCWQVVQNLKPLVR
jgi:hypothetical protein